LNLTIHEALNSRVAHALGFSITVLRSHRYAGGALAVVSFIVCATTMHICNDPSYAKRQRTFRGNLSIQLKKHRAYNIISLTVCLKEFDSDTAALI